MLCSSCGADLPSEARFCQKCGSSLEPPSPPSKDGSASSTADRFRDSAARDNGNAEDEEDLWEGGFSGKAMVGSWCLGGIATIVLGAVTVAFPAALVATIPLAVVIWIYLLGLLAYRKISVHYALTTQRFIHKVGILRQVTDRLEVIDIDDVTFEQGIVQRIFGVGTIRVISSDRSHPELVLRGIDNVRQIADMIDDVRRKERRSRGLHIEAI